MTKSDRLHRQQQSAPHPLAQPFRLLGWIAFWIQLILAVIPVLLLLFALFMRGITSEGLGTTVEASLAYACLLFLLFSLLWSFRYTRLGRKLAGPEPRPKPVPVMRMLWVGLIGNLTGMVCSILVAMGAVGTMLFKVLSRPQGAIPTIDMRSGANAAGIASSQWIVPLDVIWLQSLINTMAAQVVGIVVTLYLLYRISQKRHQQ